MNETREPPQRKEATSVSDGSREANDGRAAKAIALLNYAQALQEYLEEQLPGLWPGRGTDMPAGPLAGHLAALDALNALTSLLGAVCSGSQVDATEFKTVLTQAKAAFAESGVVGGDRLVPIDSQPSGDAAELQGFGWSIPRWCVEKLCHGMEEVSSDLAERGGTETQG